jgi:hypothetical protein
LAAQIKKQKILETLSVEILNPKAKALLMNMADLNLISIKAKASLGQRLETLRRNEPQVASLEEITKEVESVREQRYAQTNR